jgi:hypothetical protein
MMRATCFFILFLAVSVFAAAEVVLLPDLLNPDGILVDQSQMYITEGTSVFIYSLKDFKLKKKFGKRGEGPQEFMLNPPVPLIINFDGDDIIVTSVGKMSRFSKDGAFKEENKLGTPLVFYLKSLGKQYTGYGLYPEAGKIYRAVNIYDEKLKKVKEVCRIIHDFQLPGKGFNALLPYAYDTYDNKIFVPWKTEFCIDVYDDKGQYLYSIKQDYKNLEVTETDKQTIINALKTDPSTRTIYEQYIKPVNFPEYFCAVNDIRAADGKLYAFTYKKDNDKTECFIFDIKGKLLKKVFVHLGKKDINEFYPFAVKNGKVYQLLEEEEDCELHVTEIK